MNFNSTLNITESDATLQEQLEGFLRAACGSIQAAGRKLGITGQAVKDLCYKDRIPTYRWTQLVELGVPAHLLPDHGYNKPGPKPRNQ